MKTLKIDSNIGIAKRETYGGKANWLSWLIMQGYNVPETVYIKACSQNDLEYITVIYNDPENLRELERFRTTLGYDVAIRSSSTFEDSHSESRAGHYKTHLGCYTLAEMEVHTKDVVKSLRDTNGNELMGIVIQKRITAKHSGVIFSSSPFSYSKNEMIISVVEGEGEKLVSGHVAGDDILIQISQNDFLIAEHTSSLSQKTIIDLCFNAKEIERKLGFPVDIEWCTDKDGTVYLLQCRPITGMSLTDSGIVKISQSDIVNIPNEVIKHDKVNIRLIAEKNRIPISNGYIVINTFDEEDISKVVPSENTEGFSVVLIFPKNIDGNIVRRFAQNEHQNQNSAFRTCQRYEIRTFRKNEQLHETVKGISTVCNKASWKCISIIQEIYNPHYTGIVKKIDSGYLVEVAKGHFVPKGIVPTSQYIIDEIGTIKFSNEIIQDFHYEIKDGAAKKNETETTVILAEHDLQNIVNVFRPLLENTITAIEFGLLKNVEHKSLQPYLIDLVDSTENAEFNVNLISQGVISTGKVKGKVHYINNGDLTSNSLELHFHNQYSEIELIDENVVFFTETPDIALLEVIRHYNPSKIGFVFKKGSALSHFSIILREKGIPAIVWDTDDKKITDGTLVSIDAMTEGITNNKRVIL